jgi:hypothetical protein
MALIVDAVPEPSASGELILPLLAHLAVDQARPETPPQRVLALGALTGSLVIRSQAVRALAGAAEGTATHPAAASLVAYQKSQPPDHRRRSDTPPSPGHELPGDRLDWLTLGLKGELQPPGQPRIGVDLGGVTPLRDQLAHWGVVVELSGGHQHA